MGNPNHESVGKDATVPGQQEGGGPAGGGDTKGTPTNQSTADQGTGGTRAKPTGFDQIRIIGGPADTTTEIDSPVVPGVSKPPKEPKVSTPKKSTPRKPRAKNGPGTDKQLTTKTISTILKTTSEIGSLRMGNHWAFSEEECQKIAEPTAELLERYDLTKLFGEYGDWAGLIMALGTAIVPRVMISAMMSKQPAPLQQIPGGKQNVTKQPTNGQTNQGNPNGGSNHQGPPDDGETNTKQLLAGIMG